MSGTGTAQVDYDALAQQSGGTVASAQSSGVDYDSLAQQHGGTVADTTDRSTPAYWDALKDKYGLPHSVDLSKSYQENWATMSPEDFNKTDVLNFSKAYAEANPPPPEAQGYLSNLWGEIKDIGKGMFGTEGVGTASAPPIPGVGAYETAKQRISQAQTDLPGALGRTTADIGVAALPFVADTAINATGDVVAGGWRKIGNPFGLASTGEELLTQGISPRTSLLQFKPSLERAAADLKAYDAQSPINSVQDLNEAIPEIKQKIWNEEVQPALERQATKSVNMKPVADAVRSQISDEMRTFDEGNAEQLDKLADKLDSARDVASANKLLRYINGKLESYFQKFPAARRANLMANPETAGWEAARAELRNQFLNTLEDNGEYGVRDARLRYGAFDTLQDAVERRVNVADRAKPMSLGRIVGIAGAVPTAGLSVVAGELSNYLNKPDVLVRRGIGKLDESPIRTTPFAPTSATSPLTGAVLATPTQLFRRSAND